MKRAFWTVAAVLVLNALGGQTARAVDQEVIDKAIGRGVAFLKSADAQGQNGQGLQPVGANALIGLTLLECGAGADDEVVSRIAGYVRPAAISVHETYSLALAILFLDRLGDPADVPLIESMTIRLLAGQNPGGGWSYNCPDIADSEVRRLTSHLKQQTELVGRRDPPKEIKDPDAKPARRTVKDLPKEIQDQIALINVAGPNLITQGDGDNSNTQFATVALWVARRHGLPVDRALGRIDLRFRTTQNNNGGWSYVTATRLGTDLAAMPDDGSSATMTCAGLIGLIAAHGAVADNALTSGKTVPEVAADKVLKKGLATLGSAVGDPIGKRGVGEAPASVPKVGGRSFYFFWSLERVGVILDLDTIGGKDWYTWGAEILLGNQAANGSWAGEYPATVDTCFALLFLKRANLASDLTANLKGKLRDDVTLKTGGVGGDAFKGGLKSGVEGKDKPAHDETKKPKDSPEHRVPSVETEGGRMARELVHASPERRDELLDKYRDGKGATFTEALAGAIPQMSGDDKRKVREALSERLTRMKAETLGRYFQDDDPEIRRAAALAAAMKESKSLIPDLITLLSDPEPTVARAARAALKDLAGEDAGPSAEEWKAWWKKQDRK